MNKKKILLIHESLRGGGAEKVLIDILNNFDYNRYDIDFLLLQKDGVYLSQIPNQVRLLDFQIKKYPRFIKCALVRTRLYWPLLKKQLRSFFKNRHYVTVISFMESITAKCHSYLLNIGDRNISWIHTDMINNHYSKSYFPIPNSERDFYRKIDDIVFVSKEAKTQFSKLFNLDKGRVIYNLIDRNKIIEKSLLENPKKEKFTICNIGRLITVKRQDRIIEVAKLLKDKGYDIDFWIIGEGELRQKLLQQAKDLDVESNVHFLGFRNPYPYLRVADLFLLTSDAEGFPLVVSEALCLSKPIVSTAITGPIEQLGNGEYGRLTGFTSKEIADAIEDLIKNPNKLSKYSQKAKERGIKYFDVENTMNQIYEII